MENTDKKETEYGPVNFDIADGVHVPGIMMGDGSIVMHAIMAENGAAGIAFFQREPRPESVGKVIRKKSEGVDYSKSEFILGFDNRETIESLILMLSVCGKDVDFLNRNVAPCPPSLDGMDHEQIAKQVEEFEQDKTVANTIRGNIKRHADSIFFRLTRDAYAFQSNLLTMYEELAIELAEEEGAAPFNRDGDQERPNKASVTKNGIRIFWDADHPNDRRTYTVTWLELINASKDDAFKKGKAAYWSHGMNAVNPHPENSALHDAWFDGWEHEKSADSVDDEAYFQEEAAK